MTEKSLIQTWDGEAATFVEEATDGTVVVTVGADRAEMSKTEWDQLPPHGGKPPEDFNKPSA